MLWKGWKSYKSQPKPPTVIAGCHVPVFQAVQLLSCLCSAAADFPELSQNSCSLLNAAYRLGCQLLWNHQRHGSPCKTTSAWGWNAPPKVSQVVPAAAVVGGKPAVCLWVAPEHRWLHRPLAWSQPAQDRVVCIFKGSLNPASKMAAESYAVCSKLQRLTCNSQQHCKVRADVVPGSVPTAGPQEPSCASCGSHKTQVVS